MKKIYTLIILIGLAFNAVYSQYIPQHVSYTRIYDFLDEMANDNFIDLNSVIKPYSRQLIAEKLLEIKALEDKLNARQKDELNFFLDDYSLEQNKLPDYDFPLVTDEKQFRIDALPPLFTYKDTLFRARINPILGMNIYANKHGKITQRWTGIEMQSMIGKNISVYGSLRDITFGGYGNARLSDSTYLTNFPGYQYKEPSDFSDSRGGIFYAWKWGSVGLMKDNIIWGDNYNGSNIISGRAPSFPMVSLRIKPAKWFELNYIHGWLVSNVKDTTKYYVENNIWKHYRNHNKFIAANMFTFTPYRNLNISFGNSIIYAENNVQPAFFIPIGFYKSMDHTMTKGIGTENQNSQMFLNISSRNINHLHLYTSIFVDEFSVSRLKPSNKERNPISYKIGAKVNNYLVDNLSLTAEFTKTNIIVYKHSINVLTFASNSYNLGHYLGDNAQEIYLAAGYKPIRGLDINLSYLNAKHGNEYIYARRGDIGKVTYIISQPTLGDVIWTNQTVGLHALYEIFNNVYATLNIDMSDIQGHEAKQTEIPGELRKSAQETLDYFTPKFLQGKNTTITAGLSFGF